MRPKRVAELATSVNGFSCPWDSPPETLSLGRTEVHVWRALLGQASPVVQDLRAVLSEDELARAERFRYRRDKVHFMVARGLLRTLLGRYLGLTPSKLMFCYSAHGQPVLDEAHHRNGLCFNVSHSHGLALYAVTHGRRIGVDVERIRADFATEEIAERFFSANEYARIKGLPSHLRSEAFFNCWTRKEAYVKAIGRGLSLPLGQFDVSLAPGEPVALLKVEDAPEEVSRWFLRELIPVPGYKGALVVEGHGWKLSTWEGSALLPPRRRCTVSFAWGDRKELRSACS